MGRIRFREGVKRVSAERKREQELGHAFGEPYVPLEWTIPKINEGDPIENS